MHILLGGTWVWLYRPDAVSDRGPDLLVVLRADTGEVVAQVELDTVGQAAQFVQHPDGSHVMLNVDEGQDGVKLFLVSLNDGGIDLHSYEWEDRALIDIAPNGQCFMTVDHGRSDFAFHTFPSGEEMLSLPVEAFSYEYGDEFIDWNGGFLNADFAVIVITGEVNDKEWHQYYKVDLRTGKSLGRFEAHSSEIDSFQTLSDDTWIVSDLNGDPVCHRLVV